MIIHFHHTLIYYTISGQGVPLVLLHGFLESSSMWGAFLPILSEKNKVICIDLPGHGQSGIVSETHSMELFANVVQSILEKHHISEANFMGHSMGGYVTLAFAEQFPEKINSLILLNSTSAEDSDDRKQNRERALAVIDRNPSAFISMAISNLFAEKSRTDHIKIIEQLKLEASKFPIEGIKAALRGMKNRKDRTEMLKNYEKEKYLIAGEDDPIVPLDTLSFLSKSTNTKLFTLQGGHMSSFENYEDLIKIMYFIDIL